MDKNQKKQLREEIAEMMEGWIEACGPTWEEPCVFLSSSKTGLFISLTEEYEHDVTMPWDKFEASVLESDTELIEKYLPKFKRLVREMEKAINPPNEKAQQPRERQ